MKAADDAFQLAGNAREMGAPINSDRDSICFHDFQNIFKLECGKCVSHNGRSVDISALYSAHCKLATRPGRLD